MGPIGISRWKVIMRSISLLLLAAAIALAEPRPSDKGTTDYQKAAELVKQLGAPRFADRETAANQLIEMGGGAVVAIAEGAKSPDEEIRARCAAILPKAKAVRWRRTAATYLADTEYKQKLDLPLLAEWLKLVGKPDVASRKLYAEMLRTNGDLLDQVATNPKAANAAYLARCMTVLLQVRRDGKQLAAELGDVTALLFIQDRVNQDRAGTTAFDHPAHFLVNPTVIDALASKEMSPVLWKVLVHWGQGRPNEDVTSHGYFALTARNSRDPIAVPLLIQLAKAKSKFGAFVRTLAIEALGKIANQEAKSALEGLVPETTVLFVGVNGNDFVCSVGDLAFTALVAAYGKKPADYGVSVKIGVRSEFTSECEITFTQWGFPNEEARKAGLKKWKDEMAKK
jgi:hypothetical protein